LDGRRLVHEQNEAISAVRMHFYDNGAGGAIHPMIGFEHAFSWIAMMIVFRALSPVGSPSF